MAKRILIDLVHGLFVQAKKQSLLQRIMELPVLVRYIMGVGLILIGIIGLLTPIPLGSVFFLLGIMIFYGFAKTRNIIFRSIYWLRLHIIYSKIYMWWRSRK